MKRYETEVRGDVLYVETDEGPIEIGSMDDICELVGGETYTLQYDRHQRAVGWLDADEDGKLTFDVREVLADMSYEREFVTNVGRWISTRRTTRGIRFGRPCSRT